MLKSSFDVMTLLEKIHSLIPQTYEDENLMKKLYLYKLKAYSLLILSNSLREFD